jgi:hypothetical protein
MQRLQSLYCHNEVEKYLPLFLQSKQSLMYVVTYYVQVHI